MSSARKISTPNTLKKFVEDSPLLTLCATAITISGIIYGALSFIYASKHELEIGKIKADALRTEDDLRKQYEGKIRQLDDERSRIQFVVKDQSSFLDLKSLVVNEEQLGSDYKKFRSQGFAVPVSAAASIAWTWKETNEFDLISEVLGSAASAAILSDAEGAKAYQDALQRTKVYSFESPTVIEVEAAGERMKLRARSLFQSLTKADLDYASTVANHLAKNLEKSTSDVNKILYGTYVDFSEKLSRELLPLGAPLPPQSLTEKLTAEFIGSAFSVLEVASVEELIKAISSKVSPEKAVVVRQAYEKASKEKPEKPKNLEKDSKATPAELSMDAYYSALFLGAYQGLQALGDSVSVNEIGLNADYFVVKGSAEPSDTNGTKIRIYYLRICVRRDGRFYVAGYLIPAGDDLQDVKTSMSMISGFKIIR